jgi:serine/threonine protein phosphatase PrpC
MGVGAYKKDSRRVLEVYHTHASLQGVRQENEDRHTLCYLKSYPHLMLAAVFDGHGGKRCAQLASDKLPGLLDCHLKMLEAQGRTLRWKEAATDVFQQLDRLLEKELGEDRSGCTAVVALIDTYRGRVLSANVGDSQCVLSRNGKAAIMSALHKPNILEERERIDRAGHYVVRACHS